MSKEKKDEEKKQESKKEEKSTGETVSQRFLATVEKQFKAEIGIAAKFNEYEKTLVQHMFVKVDMALKGFEAKRLDNHEDNKSPFTWPNVNMAKLAVDTVHRANLGLDALIPNHIHPIPYFNSRLGKYDLDLRLGYVGKDYCRRQLAVETPLDVRYVLVYSKDKFKPLMKDSRRDVESYEFEVSEEPFNRGEVVGGFGYIVYEDPKKNRLVIVTQKDFDKAESASRTSDFWGNDKDDKSREKMQYKTIVHRVTDHLPLDPRKVNIGSYAFVEQQEIEATEVEMETEIKERANKEVIDLETGEVRERNGEDGKPEPKGEEREVVSGPGY